jgi:hypothetical protein
MLEGLEPPKNKAVFCKVNDVMNELEEADVQILQAALADTDRWKHKTLSNALRAKGVSLADTTISKHRLRVCACYRS